MSIGSTRHVPVCRFFSTPVGCRNGDKCKFLHGDGASPSQLPRESCKFFAQGSCKRGDQCWYRHERTTGPASATGIETTPAPSSSELTETDSHDELCCICQEKPSMYGLLEGCSHICCFDCLRVWRDPAGKTQDIIDSGTTKKCPYCRTPSNFITPSRMFYASGDPRKDEIITGYKASRARIPCKYFQRSPPGRRQCPFGRDCFYQHLEDDGTPYIFPHGADHYLSKLRDRVRSQNNSLYETQARPRRADNDVLQALSELMARLSSLHLFNPSDESPETSIMSRLVGDVISSLEETVGSTASSTLDSHSDLHRSQLRPSILATSEDTASPHVFRTSALPLTRAFMDSFIEDDGDGSSDYEPYLELDYDSDPYVSPPSVAGELDEALDIEPTNRYDSIGDIIENLVEDTFSSNTLRQILENAFVVNHESDHAMESTPRNSAPMSTRDHRSAIEQSSPSEQVAIGTYDAIANAEMRGQSTPTAEANSHAESSLGSHSLAPVKEQGSMSRRSRRSANQAFVTDGRGRVVATTDGAVGDANSAWLWSSSPTVQGTPQVTVDDGATKEEGASECQAGPEH